MPKTPLGFQNFGHPPLNFNRFFYNLTISNLIINLKYINMNAIAIVVGTIILTKYGLTGVLGFITDLMSELTSGNK